MDECITKMRFTHSFRRGMETADIFVKVRSAKIVAGFPAGDFDKRELKPKSPRAKAILRVVPQNMAVPR